MADDKTTDEGGSALTKLVVLLAMLVGASYVLKRKREQELDEALWEEPRPV